MTQAVSADHYLLGKDKSAFRRYRLFNEIYQPGTADCLARLPISTDMSVLEVGCGIGDTACYMARELVPKGHVVAFDQSADLIDIARQQAADVELDNITFVCAKAQDFDYPQNHFDLVHTRYVLSYSPKAGDIVKEIYGTLKPSGIFVGEEIAQVYVKRGQTQWYDKLAAWFAGLIEAGGGSASYGTEQLLDDMCAAGFADLKFTAYFPVEDQKKVVEMLRLSLSREMKKSLVDNGMATEDEVDSVIAAMHDVGADTIVSAAMALQAVGRKPFH